jgi:hypothetical protein
MHYLVLSFTTPEAMKFIYKGNTADYPTGLAWKVRTSIFKRYKAMDDTSKLELSQALMTIKMTPKESPATLFTQISTLQNRYGIYDTDEQQLLACVANALPREYKAILAAERRQNAGVITIDDAEDCLEEYYRQVYGETNNSKVANSSYPEMTFTVVTGKKCWSCGSTDHVKSECPTQKTSPRIKQRTIAMTLTK